MKNSRRKPSRRPTTFIPSFPLSLHVLSIFSLSRDAPLFPIPIFLPPLLHAGICALNGKEEENFSSLSPALFPLLSPRVSSRRKLLPSREEAGGGKSSSLPLSPLLSSSCLISLPRSLSRREFPPSLPLSLSPALPSSLSPLPSLPPSLSLSRPPSLSLSLSLALPLSPASLPPAIWATPNPPPSLQLSFFP